MQGISLVIPCLNEESTINKVIIDAQSELSQMNYPFEIIIADNGSSDNSISIAQVAGVQVVNVQEKGYGSALHYGILSSRYQWIVFADADLSYPFKELKNILGPLITNEADFVLGSRINGTIENKAMPFLNRYFGTPFLSFLIRSIYKIKVSDCNSGMRAISKNIYTQLNLKSRGMEYASEMLIRASQLNIRYKEVPILFKQDLRGRRSHLSPWPDGWRHLKIILNF